MFLKNEDLYVDAVRFIVKVCVPVLLQVGLKVVIQKANRFSPTTRLLVQRFIPFPAVGK